MAVRLGGNSTILQFLDLLQDGGFRTVDEVSQALGISRDVVDKLSNFWAGCAKRGLRPHGGIGERVVHKSPRAMEVR